jgi:hypothetical protein
MKCDTPREEHHRTCRTLSQRLRSDSQIRVTMSVVLSFQTPKRDENVMTGWTETARVRDVSERIRRPTFLMRGPSSLVYGRSSHFILTEFASDSKHKATNSVVIHIHIMSSRPRRSRRAPKKFTDYSPGDIVEVREKPIRMHNYLVDGKRNSPANESVWHHHGVQRLQESSTICHVTDFLLYFPLHTLVLTLILFILCG